MKLADGSIAQIVHAFLQKLLGGRELFYLLIVLLLAAIAVHVKSSPEGAL